jgi:hypothetical protein
MARTGYDTIIDCSDAGTVLRRSLLQRPPSQIYRDAGDNLTDIGVQPGGHMVAAVTGLRNEVVLIDLDQRSLAYRVRLPDSMGQVEMAGCSSGPVWSPDGSLLAVACELYMDSKRPLDHYTIIVIEASSGRIIKQIPVLQVSSAQTGGDVNLLWGRDGILVSYGDPHHSDGTTLAVSAESGSVELRDSTLTRAATHSGCLLFRRSGKYYVSGRRGDVTPRRVPFQVSAHSVSVTPDGRFVLFVAPAYVFPENGPPRLWAVDVDSAQVEMLPEWMVPEDGIALVRSTTSGHGEGWDELHLHRR